FVSCRRPLPSTPPLSPYTTLFRSYTAIISDRDNIISIAGGSRKEYLEKRVSPELERVIESRNIHIANGTNKPIRLYYEDEDPERSEEHTSELQSRFDLVCRLLLEK